MPGSDFSVLDQAIADLTDQATATEGTEASAAQVIAGFGAQMTKAVTDALTADDAADTGSIQAAQKAIADVTARFGVSAKALADAIAANPSPAPPPPPPPPTPAAPDTSAGR